MSDAIETVVRDYYASLRAGDRLTPYFLADESTVKFGIGEALYGYDDVATALTEQTETTDAWSVESSNLVVEERDEFATMADEVTMAWTDTDSGDRHRFETRWSGTLVERGRTDARENADDGGREDSGVDHPPWAFLSMHVSAPHEL